MSVIVAGWWLALLAEPEWPAPPFVAEVRVESAYVRRDEGPGAPAVGLLAMGDRVLVLGVLDEGRVRLDPVGVIRRDLLRDPRPGSEGAGWRHPEYEYGTTRSEVKVRAEPERRARALATLPADRSVALVPDAALAAEGWGELHSGGFLPRAALRLARPSDFVGVPDPPGPLAFLLTEATARTGTRATALPRHAAVPVLELDARGDVRSAAGTLRRERVRLAVARPRPPDVPSGARWVHVDVREQILTAYDGDRWVYATLVSSGRAETPTRLGTFRVVNKLLHAPMHGPEGTTTSSTSPPYFVDQVPRVIAFHGNFALHGTFWHDGFGWPASHGCVNLAPADARWLFDWAPPALPLGWRGVVATSAAPTEPLWIVIARPPRVRGPLTGSR